jgi:hypothetical protein
LGIISQKKKNQWVAWLEVQWHSGVSEPLNQDRGREAT